MGKIQGWKKVKNFTKRHDNEQRFVMKNEYGLFESLTIYKDKRGFWVLDTPDYNFTSKNYSIVRKKATNYMKAN